MYSVIEVGLKGGDVREWTSRGREDHKAHTVAMLLCLRIGLTVCPPTLFACGSEC